MMNTTIDIARKVITVYVTTFSIDHILFILPVYLTDPRSYGTGLFYKDRHHHKGADQFN